MFPHQLVLISDRLISRYFNIIRLFLWISENSSITCSKFTTISRSTPNKLKSLRRSLFLTIVLITILIYYQSIGNTYVFYYLYSQADSIFENFWQAGALKNYTGILKTPIEVYWFFTYSESAPKLSLVMYFSNHFMKFFFRRKMHS